MKTFLVSDNEALQEQILEVFRKNLIECPSANIIELGFAESKLQEDTPKLVVLVLSPNPSGALGCLRGIRAANKTPVIAIGPGDDANLILRTLQDGADHYVDESDLAAGLHLAISQLRVKIEEPTEPGTVIAVVGTSGGSGTSTIAANLSVVLAEENERCALLDLNLQTGDLANLLDLKPEHSLTDLCGNLSRLDSSMFDQLLTKHDSGVHLLASPRIFVQRPLQEQTNPETSQQPITLEGIQEAVTMARKLYPYVVLDVEHNLGEEQLVALRQADEILIVLRLDYSCVLNTQIMMDHLERSGIDRSTMRLVANRYGQPKESPIADAERAIGEKIIHKLPNDPKRVNQANNTGVPVVVGGPKWSGVSRGIVQLAQLLSESAKDEQDNQ